MSDQLALFADEPVTGKTPETRPVKLPVACKHPSHPACMAPPHPDDAWDAIGLKPDRDFYCCAVHYVRILRWKYDLDA